MAVRSGLAKGHDADYPNRSIDYELERGHGARAGDYYLVASEPRGRAFGRAAEALGLTVGGEITKEQYDAIIKQRRHPETKEQLGRSWNAGQKAREKAAGILAGKLAAEPHATELRKWQLEKDAAKEAKQSCYYIDQESSLSKTITVFGESLHANEWQAREAGDDEAAAYWAGEAAAYEQILYDANAAALRFFEREAGYCRRGSHAGQVDGQETGRFHEAGLVGFSFLQHTTRDDDPHHHIHNVIAMVCKGDEDGRFSVPDTYGFNTVIPAMSAIFAARLESLMTARFDVEWVPRSDGRGREIAGITPPMTDPFSTRRNTIEPEVQNWAREYEEEHGRRPTQRETNQQNKKISLAQRKGKAKENGQEKPPDFGALRPRWARDFFRETGERLENVAPSVSRTLRGSTARDAQKDATRSAQMDAEHGTGGRRIADLAPDTRRKVALMAVARVQAKQSTWTRYDLLQQLSAVMPAEAAHLDPDVAEQTLHDLADEIVTGMYEPVTSLDTPQLVDLPPELIRADGRPVYHRHAGVTCATGAQIGMETQLLEDASAEREPLISREVAARLLGADVATLDAQARMRPEAGLDARTSTGLRLDQAAAALTVLTDPRTISVLTGPPGSGKTYTMAAIAKAAKDAGVPAIYGITCSQAARNELAEACARQGVHLEAFNSTQFVQGISRQAGDRYRIDVTPGSLFLLDEASMTSAGHYAPIVAEVRRTEGKGIAGGDQAQLTAVEGGGTMGQFARQLGFAQLAEPVRFNAAWERDASLRLRAGDESVLDVYDQHGRIRGGTPEEMMEEAAQTAVNYLTADRDVLLMAQGRDQCRELSRRVRDELVRFGVVGDGKTVPLAEGAQASVDDLVILRRNDHARGLANGDVVRIETIEDDGEVRVRKATGRDRDTGQPVFGKAQSLKTLENYDSAYGTTVHSAEGSNAQVGLAHVTGSESREWLTVALTRGADENMAFVASSSPRAADVKAGVRAAPELGRAERLEAERAGQDPGELEEEPGAADPLAVLATVMRRQDTQLSATETRDRAAANADHLGLLAPMWDDAAKAMRADRYREILAETVPAAHQAGLDESPRATWLFRSLRGAEAAGMDAREVIRAAVESRSLDGADDVAAVIDRRIRDQIGEHPTPEPAGTYWSELPEDAPEHVKQLARLQDQREVRLGQHAAVVAPQWALDALGPVPDGEERAGWEDRAGKIHAYRERYNYGQADAIGAEPSGNNPEQRARWHRAFSALGPADGPDLRNEATGSLLLKRDTYRYETAWAPRHPGDAVKESRVKVHFAEQAILRAQAEQQAAEKRGDLEEAAHHAAGAGAWQAKLDTSYRARAEQLEKAEAAYNDWDHTTRQAREQALAADQILRQREPGLVTEPLKTAEPPRVTSEEIAELDAETSPSWLDALTEQVQQVQEQVADRRSIREPGPEPEEDPAGGYAWPAPPPMERDAIIHPPAASLPPAPQVEHGWEAGWDRNPEPEPEAEPEAGG